MHNIHFICHEHAFRKIFYRNFQCFNHFSFFNAKVTLALFTYFGSKHLRLQWSDKNARPKQVSLNCAYSLHLIVTILNFDWPSIAFHCGSQLNLLSVQHSNGQFSETWITHTKCSFLTFSLRAMFQLLRIWVLIQLFMTNFFSSKCVEKGRE